MDVDRRLNMQLQEMDRSISIAVQNRLHQRRVPRLGQRVAQQVLGSAGMCIRSGGVNRAGMKQQRLVVAPELFRRLGVKPLQPIGFPCRKQRKMERVVRQVPSTALFRIGQTDWQWGMRQSMMRGHDAGFPVEATPSHGVTQEAAFYREARCFEVFEFLERDRRHAPAPVRAGDHETFFL